MDFTQSILFLLDHDTQSLYSKKGLQVQRIEFSQNESFACLITHIHAIVIQIDVLSISLVTVIGLPTH
jgi:hypothetical protein